MATITAQQVVEAGLEATFTAAAADQDFQAGTRIFVQVKNGDASDHDITFTTPATVRGLAVADLAVTVTAAEERLIGPFPEEVYGTGSPKLVAITWSATTSMTIAVLRL